MVVANSFVPSDFLVDGEVSGLGTVHPLLTLRIVSTWILPLHVVCFNVEEEFVVIRNGWTPKKEKKNNTCQSAYRPGHTTETALLKVVNDLFLSLNKGNISVLALLTLFQHLTQLIILSLYIVSILTSDLLMQSCNGFHLICLIVHTTSLYLIIVLLLLLYTQVFLKVQFLALCFSPCILSLCLSLSSNTLSNTIHLVMAYNNICLFPLIEYVSYFTLCSHV